MALVNVNEAKSYLRVDSSDDNALIESLLSAAESLCKDVARLTDDRWEVITSMTGEERNLTVEEEYICKLLRIAILYTVGYFYEHREEADHHDLTMTLRNLLFAIREGAV